MGKSICFNAGPFSIINSTTRFLPFGNTSNALLTATEVVASTLNAGEDFTVSNLQCYVKANTRTAGTAEVRLRWSNSDADPVCLIPFGTTGLFHDSTGTESFTAGTTINYAIKYGSGGTGQVDFNAINAVVDTTSSNTITKILNYNTGNMGANTLYAHPIADSLNGQSTEANAQVKFPAGSIKNLYTLITSNSRNGNCNVMVRKNGADILTTLIDNDGPFQDTTSNVSVADGDLINFKTVRGGSSGSLFINTMSFDFVTTDDSFPAIGSGTFTFSPPSATDYFMQIGGTTIEADTDTQTKNKFYITDYAASKMRLHLTTNTVASTSSFTFRKNGADTALTISIPASTTGAFEDTTHSVSISNGDDINYKLAAGGSGSMVGRYTSIRFMKETTPVVNNTSRNFFKLVGRF